MKKVLVLVAVIVAIAAMTGLLSGCSLVPGGGQVEKAAVTVIDAATADRKAYNDRKGEVLLTLPCDISIGAYYRMTNSVQQEALTMLCSGKRLEEPEPRLALTGTATVPLAGVDPEGAP